MGFETVDLRDVRVIQRRERLGFAGEAREPCGIAREQLREHLDRDLAIERRVARAIDLTQSPGAERRADDVRADRRAGRDRHGFTTPPDRWMASTAAKMRAARGSVASARSSGNSPAEPSQLSRVSKAFCRSATAFSMSPRLPRTAARAQYGT